MIAKGAAVTIDVLPVGLILTPNSARGRATLEAILSSAVAVFSESTHGRSASIAAVAKRISLSPAAIYQYFPDREAVLAAAIEQDVAKLFDEAIAAVADLQSPMSSNEFGTHLETLAGQHPLAVAAIVDEGIDVATLPRVQLRIETCVTMLVREIKHAQERDVARTDIEVRKLAEAIMFTSLYTLIPDRLSGRPDSQRSRWARYLAVAAMMKSVDTVDTSEYVKGHSALVEVSA